MAELPLVSRRRLPRRRFPVVVVRHTNGYRPVEFLRRTALAAAGEPGRRETNGASRRAADVSLRTSDY